MPLLVCEDSPEDFGPLTLTRATFELRYGTLCPLDRALQLTRDVVLRVRPHLAAYVRARTGLPVNEDGDGEAFPGLPATTAWDILARSDAHIAADYENWIARHTNHRDGAMMTGSHLVGRASEVHIGTGAVVLPGCVLDSSGGPIMIGERARVSLSQIQGPAFIGPGCVLDGARVRPGTSLGPNCKVGGEISATIFQSRVNKAHDGFVGHTWAGRWVNFGAGSTTSNLKNTYGTVRFARNDRDIVDTSAQFLGSLIGDHSKIGIMQGLTTGANIGTGVNLFGGGISPKWVPSFTWGGADGWAEHRFNDCLKTVRATLGRRNAVLRSESEDVLRQVFENSCAERERFLNHRDTEAQRGERG